MGMESLQSCLDKKGNQSFTSHQPQNKEFMAASSKQVDWHLEVLPKQARKAFDFLSNQKWLKRSPWYLAGGTALALQTGHRSSVDLDLFTQKDNFSNVALLRHFLSIPDWKTNITEEGTVYGELFKTKVSFISYPLFKPAESSKWYGTLRVLRPLDLAVMKVVTISQRGRKRDFIDLYWCAKHIEPLAKIIIRLKTQYPAVAHNYHHILKSLVYFSDAENDPMPSMLYDVSWTEVKKYFQKEIPEITHLIINSSRLLR